MGMSKSTIMMSTTVGSRMYGSMQVVANKAQLYEKLKEIIFNCSRIEEDLINIDEQMEKTYLEMLRETHDPFNGVVKRDKKILFRENSLLQNSL